MASPGLIDDDTTVIANFPSGLAVKYLGLNNIYVKRYPQLLQLIVRCGAAPVLMKGLAMQRATE